MRKVVDNQECFQVNPGGEVQVAEKTILVADDDPEIVKLLSIQLKRAGYEVLAAMDGLQAVMIVHKSTPDLIILDMLMPAGGGASVLEKLGGSIQTMGIPVIILTSFEHTKERAEQFKAFRFFTKPHDPDELLKAIEEAIGPGKSS
jgi:CheY-like chemotaxis protein